MENTVNGNTNLNGEEERNPKNKKQIAVIVTSLVLTVAMVLAAILIPIFVHTTDYITETEEGGSFTHDGATGAEGFFGRIGDSLNKFFGRYENWAQYPGDPSMKIDGVLNEKQWKGKAYYHATLPSNDGSGLTPSFDITAFLTKYGVYVGSTLYDTNIVSDNERSTAANTSWSFRFAAFDKGDKVINDKIFTQLFEVLNNGDVNSRWSSIDRKTRIEGEPNSGETESVTLEMFVPWQALQVNPKTAPDVVYIRPVAFVHLPGEDTQTNISFVQATETQIVDYCVFDKNGYTKPDRPGAVLGDAKYGQPKTPNWDISKEKSGIVRSSEGDQYHYIYFKNEFGDNFMVEATLIPYGSLGDAGPKAGIRFMNLNGIHHGVMLNVGSGGVMNNLVDGPSGTKNFKSYTLVTINNDKGAWNQTYLPLKDVSRVNDAATTLGTKLTVIKSGPEFWYFVDGKFMYSESIEFMDSDVFPGFWALGCDIQYQDYSCKTLTDAQIESYLNNKGVYRIQTSVDGGSGTVSTDKISVSRGEEYNLTVKCESGYRTSSIKINGVEKIGDARANSHDGVYTVRNVTSNQNISVTFSEVSGTSVSGTIKSGKETIPANLIFSGVTDRTLYYEYGAGGDGEYSLAIPNGRYTVTVSATGYKGIKADVTVSGNTKKDFNLEESDFATTVSAQSGTVSSSWSAWDTSDENSGKVKTSFESGGKNAPLYFKTRATDFVAEVTVEYTTEFVEGIDYQPDMFGGFTFSDGKNRGSIWLNKSGVTYNPPWTQIRGLVAEELITKSNPKPATFAITKKGSVVNVYINGVMVRTFAWSTISNGIDAKSIVAVGLSMFADKNGEVTFSNYSIKNDAKSIDAFINDHTPKTVPLQQNGKFASEVAVGSKSYKSSDREWNLDEIQNNIAKAEIPGGQGPHFSNLYFTAHGNRALVSAKIEYATAFQDGVDYQDDLCAGFAVNSASATGTLHISKNRITSTGWKQNPAGSTNYLTKSDGAKPVTFTIALNGDGNIRCFFDGRFVLSLPVGDVVSGANGNTDLVYGLTVYFDKKADARFSDISITTDADAVSAYIAEHSGGGAQPGGGDDTLGNAVDDQELVNSFSENKRNESPTYTDRLSKGYKGNTDQMVKFTENTTMFIGDSIFDVRDFWKNFYETESLKDKDVFTAGIGSTRAWSEWPLLVKYIFRQYISRGFAPKNIVVNLGSNDVAGGKTPQGAANAIQALFAQLKELFPNTNFYYTSICPRGEDGSIPQNNIRECNRIMKEWCESSGSYVHFADIEEDGPLHKADTKDGIHPKDELYESRYIPALKKAGCEFADR